MHKACLSHGLMLLVLLGPLAAAARIGELPEESLKRYGAPAAAAKDTVILPNATNLVYAYTGWQITAAYVDAKTARIRYRKGRVVEESVPVWLKDAKDAGLMTARQAKIRAERMARHNRPNDHAEMKTVTYFKEEPLSCEEIKNILKSESPIGNWREYDPKTQRRNAVFSFAAKQIPETLSSDAGIVAHMTPTCVTLEKPAVIQEFEKQGGPPKDAASPLPKF